MPYKNREDQNAYCRAWYRRPYVYWKRIEDRRADYKAHLDAGLRQRIGRDGKKRWVEVGDADRQRSV